MDWQREELRADGFDPDTIAEEDLRAAMLNEREVDTDLVSRSARALASFSRWLSDTNSHMEEVPLSETATHEEFREWRRRQALREASYFAPRSASLAPETADQATILFEDILTYNAQLEHFLELTLAEADENWAEVRPESWRITKIARGVGRYVSRTVSNTVAVVTNAWGGLLNRFRAREQRCISDQSTAEAREAERRGVSSPRDADFEDEGRMEVLLDDADGLLGSLEDGEDEEERSLVEIEHTIEALRSAGQSLAEGTAGSDAVSVMEISLDSISDRVCSRARRAQTSALRNLLGSLRTAAASVLDVLTPSYGVRGMSMSVGPLSRGFEEVIDFRNREIGYFRSEAVGVSPGMFGISALSYSAVGWKGYKQNWTLQEGYQSVLCRSGPIGNIPVDFLTPVHAGVKFCTDADNSGSVWVPEPNGFNSVIFTAGVGQTVLGGNRHDGASMLNRLGGAIGFQMERKWMYTSECFDNLRSFLGGIYRPWCGSCRASDERVRLGVMRAGTHAVAMPLVTEILYTFLAWRHERIRPEGQATGCSDLSTRNRADPSHVMGSAGRQLARATETLDQIETQIDQVRSDLLEAIEANPNNLIRSQEWRELTEAHGFCAKRPVLPSALPVEDVRDVLLAKPREELVTLCRGMPGMMHCGSRSSERLADDLALHAAGRAGQTNPFGRCDRSSECPLQGQTCANEDGADRKRCFCDESHCHRLDAQGYSICRAAPVAPRQQIEQVVDEMWAWLAVRRIDLGFYVRELHRMGDPQAGADEDEDDGI